MVHEARGDSQRAADCYRKVIAFIRDDPDDYDPASRKCLSSSWNASTRQPKPDRGTAMVMLPNGADLTTIAMHAARPQSALKEREQGYIFDGKRRSNPFPYNQDQSRGPFLAFDAQSLDCVSGSCGFHITGVTSRGAPVTELTQPCEVRRHASRNG
jgi:hypothetical protein